ncbi:MAG: hypothetical protein EKK47_20965 [Burkholderiales bacterium]|nr:MAG: hypothetical protein EKK47_20965 [Burkholderiales bacterium]
MDVYVLYALVSALSVGTLTILYGLLWLDRRQPWAAWFTVAFFFHTLRYGLNHLTQPVNGQSTTLGILLVLPSILGMTLGMLDYVELSGLAKRGLQYGTALACLVLAILALPPSMPVQSAAIWFSAFVLSWAALALWATIREKSAGYGLVCLAMLVFPVFAVVSRYGWIDPSLLRYLAAIPISMAGVTLLFVGMQRAQRTAQTELQRREQVEGELRALNESLESRVAQRTADLQQMIDGLESFNRSVSHDLRGPLGGIAGVSRVALDALERGDSQNVARLLHAIAAQADASVKLVAALLALARVGDVPINRRDIELDSFVEDLVTRLRMADPHEAPLPVRIQHPLPQVNADAEMLTQVFVNLINNALKFSRENGQQQVLVGATRVDDDTVLYVKDNGVGFDPEKASNLFKPFARQHGQHYEGFGVGLSIVKRIVQRHGGQVWAQSAPGQGATFSFTLTPQHAPP